jgi:hypothetical protein
MVYPLHDKTAGDDVMPKPRQEFETAEFLRYSAECRRIASFARPPVRIVKPDPTVDLWAQWADWLGRRPEYAKPYRALATQRR